MRSIRKIFWVACSLFLSIFCSTLAFALPPVRIFPSVPAPPGASTYWIAEYIEQNTIPMQIKGFESSLKKADVIKFYEKWFAQKQGFNASVQDDADVLGAKVGLYQLTVKIREKEGMVIGTLAAAAVYEPGRSMDKIGEIGKGFPKPVGSEVISDTLSYDPGIRNRTIILKNQVSVETNALYLREEMIKLGWTLMSDRTLEAGQSSALVFRKNAQEMIVTISKKTLDAWIVSSQTSPD